MNRKNKVEYISFNYLSNYMPDTSILLQKLHIALYSDNPILNNRIEQSALATARQDLSPSGFFPGLQASLVTVFEGQDLDSKSWDSTSQVPTGENL